MTEPTAQEKLASLLELKLVTLPISELKAWEHNPRVGHDVKGIAASIEAFGYLSPIVVQKDTHRVLAGHGRLQALKAQGVTEVEVTVANLDDKAAAAFTIADNKLTDISEFDFADVGGMFEQMGSKMAKLTGFSDTEIEAAKRSAREVRDAEAVGAKANSATIYAGDAKAHGESSTMFITMPSREKLREVKREISRLQAGNEKSIGQVVYEVLCKPESK